MSRFASGRYLSGLGAAALLVAGSLAVPAGAGEFTYSEKTNEKYAKILNIPVWYTVPASARLSLPETFNTTDRLVDFKHPDGKGASGDVGLRLVIANRSGFGRRMAQTGLLKTGDIILTFRSEWGGAGAYPNIQMGISHTGLVYVKDGVAYQLDIPLTTEYLGSGYKGDFSSEHYRTLKYLHIIRPRGLTEQQRANIVEWATRLSQGAPKIYPSQIVFNQDYNAPKYKRGKPLTFVKDLGQIALGGDPPGKLDEYCSEFVWSVLAMRNCKPSDTSAQFSGARVPSCVAPVMTPMDAAGDYVTKHGRSSNAGLADGPLMVIDALKKPTAERDQLIHQVFVADPKRQANMSVGHQQVAKEFQPKFEPLEEYYKLAVKRSWNPISTWYASRQLDKAMPDNYSPTSFLINTMLPVTNKNRTMDYVATVMFE